MFLLRLNLIEVAIQSSANMPTPTTVGCTDFLLQTGLTLPPICPSRAPIDTLFCSLRSARVQSRKAPNDRAYRFVHGIFPPNAGVSGEGQGSCAIIPSILVTVR